jgi:hypothetical protein
MLGDPFAHDVVTSAKHAGLQKRLSTAVRLVELFCAERLPHDCVRRASRHHSCLVRPAALLVRDRTLAEWMSTFNPFVIVTGCDAKYGDFLIEHWLRSLQENVDLRKIDVVVLDYGLSDGQRATLRERNVRCLLCQKDGHVCNLRYRDIVRLLDETEYEQVLSVDAGDVIFQANVSHLFEFEQEHFRAVAEEFRTPFFEAVLDLSEVREEHRQTMLDYLHGKPMLNTGVLLGPANKYREFWREFQRYCQGFACYGVDQFIFNYYAYSRGVFRSLAMRYNFVLVTAQRSFRIRQGVFYDESGGVIPIVHNAGNKDWIRSIERFGYGPNRNHRKTVSPIVVRWGSYAIRAWNQLGRKIRGVA